MDVILELIIALCIGSILGLERDIHARREGKEVSFGMKIFSVMALLGFSVAYSPGPISIIILFFAFCIILFFSVSQLRMGSSSPGMTTGVALVTAFLLGGMSGAGYPLEAIIVSMMIISILGVKERTHRFAGILTNEDLASALNFLIIVVILLPLAYTMGDVHPLIGSGKLIDPVKTLLIVIFVSSFSFVSYIVIKTVGAMKGLEITSFLGGFVNSAASTVSLSRLAVINPKLKSVSKRGIILANLSMILKDVILITVIAGTVFLKGFMVPMAVLMVASLTGVLVTRSSKTTEKCSLDLGTPFAIIPAAKFGVLFVVLSVLSYYGMELLGVYGVYAISIGGLVSTTSVSASLGALFVAGEIELDTMLTTILLALGLGSISKVGIAWAYDRVLAKKIALIQGVVTALCFIMAFFQV